MTFSLAKNGVSRLTPNCPIFDSIPPQERLVPELVAATGSRHLGGLTLFQACNPLT